MLLRHLGNIRYYYKFDEGDESEGTVPNIEQYKFNIENGQANLVIENYNLGGSGGSSSWGSITGTLSNQTDLQNALDGKVEAVKSRTQGNTTYNSIYENYGGALGMHVVKNPDNPDEVTEVTVEPGRAAMVYGVIGSEKGIVASSNVK